jgi:hypothetical protein
LKSLILHLSSLSPPDPPEDFLRRIHEKMDRPGRLAGLLEWVRAPLRTGMPLPLAGALVAAVLVVSIVTYQYKPGSDNAVGPTERKATALQESRSERVPSPLSGSHLSHRGELSLEKEAPPVPVKLEDHAPMEITLLFKARSEYLTDQAMEPMHSAPASPRGSSAPKGLSTPPSQPARHKAAKESIDSAGYRARRQGVEESYMLPELLESLGGTIVSSEREPDTGRIKVLLARIPSDQLNAVYKALKSVASPDEFAPGPQEAEKDIFLRITCLYE